MKKRIAVALLFSAVAVQAEPLQWNVPYFGTLNLNVATTEALIGYDGIVKQAVGGVSLPIWVSPKDIVALQVGAVAPWQTDGPTVEPYVAMGHDILREIPGLDQYKSLHLNVFGRYVSDQGKAGAGISFSYTFAK